MRSRLTRPNQATILIFQHNSKQALGPSPLDGLGNTGVLSQARRASHYQMLIGHRRGVTCHLNLREGVITFWVVDFIFFLAPLRSPP